MRRLPGAMDEKGILTASELIRWKRSMNKLHVPVNPRMVILCSQKVDLGIRSFFLQKISGLVGSHLCVNPGKGIYLSSGWGLGGSALVAVCEELFELGARSFILIGMVGTLIESVQSGERVLSKDVLCAEGTSAYYLKDNQAFINCPGKSLIAALSKLELHEKTFVSTDAPFRETIRIVESWKKESATIVDMETAGLYAFAGHYGAEAASIGIVSDSLSGQQWNPPQNYSILKTKMNMTVNEIVKLFA